MLKLVLNLIIDSMNLYSLVTMNDTLFFIVPEFPVSVYTYCFTADVHCLWNLIGIVNDLGCFQNHQILPSHF